MAAFSPCLLFLVSLTTGVLATGGGGSGYASSGSWGQQQPSQQNFGGGGYGRQQQQQQQNVGGGGYGGGQSGFGQQPQQGFGQQPQPGFGQQPQPGWGQQPQPGFGQQPMGGFGQQPQPGFGGTGGLGVPPGGFSQGMCNFDPKCFTQTPNMALKDAYPIVRETPISCKDCLNLCLKRLQSPFPPYLCKAAVYDYQHQSCDLFAVTAGSGPGAQATCVAYPGRDFFQPTQAAGTCPVTGGDSTGNATTTGPQTTAAPGPTAAPVTDAPTTAAPETTVTTTEPQSDCPPGESVKMTLVDSEEIADCFPSDLVDDCPDPTQVEPQKTLVGFAKEVVDAEDRRDCIQLCLETTDFDCLSGLFFPDEAEQNCVLNDANQDTDPDLFIDEDTETVDYFEPQCLTRNRLRARTRSRLRALRLRRRLQKLRARARGRAQLRRFKLTESRIMSEITTDIGTRKPFDGKWTLWSRCSASTSGNKYKYKRCKNNDIRKCTNVKRSCPGSRKTSNRRDSTFRRRMSTLARLRALRTGRS